jgi:hypothetical protein
MKTTLLTFALVVLCMFRLIAQTGTEPEPESATLLIPVTPGPISGNTCIPATGTQTYTVPNMLGVRYLWQIVEGPTHTQILSGQNTNSVVVRSLNEGNSVLRVYAYIGLGGGGGCSDPFKQVEIRKIFTIPNTDELTGPTCMDASMLAGNAVVMYGIKPYLGTYNSAPGYTWTISSGLQELYRSPDGSAVFLKVVNSATDQQVSVKIGSACNGNTNVFTKTLRALAPAPTFESGSFCISDVSGTQSVFSVTNNPQGVFSYRWVLPDNWTIIAANGPDSTQVTVQFNDSGRGNITVIASRNGCGDRFSSFGVNRYPDAAPPISGPECIAFGNTTPLTYKIQGGANTYDWEVFPASAGWTVSSGNGPSITIVPSFGNVPLSGEIEVRATIEGDCGAAPVTSILKVKVGPDKPATINGMACVPYGTTSLTYSIAEVARATGYQWTIPATWSVFGATNGTSITVNPNNTNGQLQVIALGCSSTTASTEVVLPVTMGPATPAAISGAVCVSYGTTGMNYSISPVANAMGYLWEVPAGWSYTASSDQRTITVTATNNTAGTIRVRALGCSPGANSSFRDLQVSVGPPQPDVISGASCIVTPGGHETYTVTPVTNATGYTWTFPSGWTIQGVSNTPSVSVIPGSNGGIISVRALGCDSNTGSIAREFPVAVAPGQPGLISYYVNGDINNTCMTKGTSQTVTFSIAAAVAGASGYTWTFPSAWAIAPITTTGLSVTVSTDANNGGTVAVTANSPSACNSAPRTLSVIRSGLEFCIMAAPLSNQYKFYIIDEQDIHNGTAVFYRWFRGSNATPFLQGPNESACPAPNDVGSVRVEITDSNGCVTAFEISTSTPTGTSVCNYTPESAFMRSGSTARGSESATSSALYEETTTGGLQLSPNPASAIVHITLPDQVSQANVLIYSANGAQIATMAASKNDVSIDVSGYKDGMYYIVMSSSLRIVSGKFVVKH